MLQRLTTSFPRRFRRDSGQPPQLPERFAPTFLVAVADQAEATRAVQSFETALSEVPEARLVICGPADVEGAHNVEILAVGDPRIAALREEAITTEDPTPEGFRRAHLRYRELDELLLCAEGLYQRLMDDAAEHPRVGELGPLMETALTGYSAYVRTGETPPEANDATRQLTVITDGAFNRAVQTLHADVYPPRGRTYPGGILSEGLAELDTALECIRTDGYYVFDAKVPEHVLDDLERFARETPILPQPGAHPDEILYDEASPVAPAYYLQPDRTLASPVTRTLWADPSLLSMAEHVLGCEPALSHFGMWWSTTASRKAVSEIAQLYHIDMDKLAFIQFFVYVTDVGPENGPHTFVRGSHRHKPLPLRRDGRISDRDIRRHFAPEDLVEIEGTRGTMFAVDTSAFHKGKPVTAGHRLVFQWVYATSLFGSRDVTVPLPGPVESSFLEAIQTHPRLFERVDVSALARRS